MEHVIRARQFLYNDNAISFLYRIICKYPDYYGVQYMVSFFDNSVEAVDEWDYNSNSFRRMTIAGFQKERAPVALIWYKDQIRGDGMKWNLVSLTIKNTKFKEPVYVEMVSGKVFEIDSSDWESKGSDVVFKSLPIWDSVIMLAERSQVLLNGESEN